MILWIVELYSYFYRICYNWCFVSLIGIKKKHCLGWYTCSPSIAVWFSGSLRKYCLISVAEVAISSRSIIRLVFILIPLCADQFSQNKHAGPHSVTIVWRNDFHKKALLWHFSTAMKTLDFWHLHVTKLSCVTHFHYHYVIKMGFQNLVSRFLRQLTAI